MTVQHTPPSTYILRNLHDVAVPESVSWMPQTLGWQLLAVALVVGFLYVTYRVVKTWWHNRYRREAIAAIENIDTASPYAADAVYRCLKLVLVHINPQHSSSFSTSFLEALDSYEFDGSERFLSPLGAAWMDSLVNPNATLSSRDVLQLQQQSLKWVRCHQAVSNQLESSYE